MINAKPVNFKLGDYINQAFELMKKNLGGFVVAFLFCMIMSCIPFCAILAVGNFYKYCRKIHRGENPPASEIFNFDDFTPYLKLQLILLGFFMLMYVPLLFIIPWGGRQAELSPVMSILFSVYILALICVIYYFTIRGFYVPALMSLRNVTSVKTAWQMSKTMTKGNFLNILLFTIVVSLCAQVGVLACFVGMFVTLPFAYVGHYFAFDDALNQLENDSLKTTYSNGI